MKRISFNIKPIVLLFALLLAITSLGFSFESEAIDSEKNIKPFIAAAIQFNPKLNERDKNIQDLLKVVAEAAENGAKLIVTPEMATTGYYY